MKIYDVYYKEKQTLFSTYIGWRVDGDKSSCYKYSAKIIAIIIINDNNYNFSHLSFGAFMSICSASLIQQHSVGQISAAFVKLWGNIRADTSAPAVTSLCVCACLCGEVVISYLLAPRFPLTHGEADWCRCLCVVVLCWCVQMCLWSPKFSKRTIGLSYFFNEN